MAIRASAIKAKQAASPKNKQQGMTHSIGKRFYFETQNGMHVSVRAHNGLLAVKQLPKWILL